VLLIRDDPLLTEMLCRSTRSSHLGIAVGAVDGRHLAAIELIANVRRARRGHHLRHHGPSYGKGQQVSFRTTCISRIYNIGLTPIALPNEGIRGHESGTTLPPGVETGESAEIASGMAAADMLVLGAISFPPTRDEARNSWLL